MNAVVQRPGPAGAPPAEQVGSYVLVRRIGAGGMAEVWLGRHVVSGGVAAVKRLAPGARGSLAREAKIVARLAHPHVVPLFEFGDGFVVMPYIEGTTLARRMATPMVPAVAVRIARQIASALAHAHARGVVHRDVKPSNILLDRRETAFLADFGIAAAADVQLEPGSGTLRYMAPEQLQREPPTAATDQYALALTLLEVLSGGHLGTDLRAALAALAERVAPELAAVVGRALAPAPGDRFPDIAAFAAALAEVDVSAASPWHRRAEPVRSTPRRAWLAHPERVVATAADLVCADYRVGQLVADGLLDRAPVEAALARAGLAELGFSVHAATTRLGPLTDPAMLARVRDVIVLAHGWSSTRTSWRLLGPALARDNAETLVLAPDLHGFGVSRYAGRPTAAQATPRMLVEVALALPRLLGLGGVPTVLVAHSMAGMGALALDEAELPPTVTRMALNPILVSHEPRLRWAFRIGAWVAATFGRIAWLRRRLVVRLSRVPMMFELEAGDSAQVIANQLALPTGIAARQMASMSRVRLTEGRQRRLVLVTGKDDPITCTPEVVAAAVADLGLDPAQVHLLASGGHTPQLPLAHHPEWTARNVDEICHLVQSLLATAHQPTSRPGGDAAVTV